MDRLETPRRRRRGLAKRYPLPDLYENGNMPFYINVLRFNVFLLGHGLPYPRPVTPEPRIFIIRCALPGMGVCLKKGYYDRIL
jgi:hypothetical protein